MQPRLAPRALVVALVLAVAAPRVLRAQGSPISDLLSKARAALNDLRFPAADSLALSVIASFGERLSREQRIEAMSIAAASLFPDPTSGGVQRPDSAKVFLRRLIREDPGASFRQELAWRGLDSLYAVVQRTTLAVGVRPKAEYVMTGPHGEAVVEAFTTRPARFRLAMARADDGVPVALDSARPGTQASLRLHSFVGDVPALPSGEYVIAVSAKDAETRDSVAVRYLVTVSSPPLQSVRVPTALDSSQLLPEIAPPARARGLIAGLVLGGGAAMAATMTGPAPLKSGNSSGLGLAVGVGMAAGAILAGYMDRGQALPGNVEANARLRAAFVESVAAAHAENRRRLDAHRTTLTFHGESR